MPNLIPRAVCESKGEKKCKVRVKIEKDENKQKEARIGPFKKLFYNKLRY